MLSTVVVLILCVTLNVADQNDKQSSESDRSPLVMEMIPKVEALDNHQFQVLEQCLYYYLASEAQEKTKNFGGFHALSAFPPTITNPKGSRITLLFNQITLQHFVLNEFLRDLNINGYMDVTWVDNRLKWNTDHWRLKKMEIRSFNHIWVPILDAQT
ncbi:unnamed protein product [Thelazia callipaeda]|uniref:Neur_chan_LBD domain-containing protein n=1 Tax=Thelazia callipaeda TaxID=103827 RepID=A0A0N5CT54_THECL|nr:unnamed protein product [Thelazia callipaeda]